MSNYFIIPNSSISYSNIKHNFTLQHTSLASDNEFIPVNTLENGTLLSNHGNKDFLYNFMMYKHVFSTSRYNSFVGNIISSHIDRTTQISRVDINSTGNRYYSNSGMVFTKLEDDFTYNPLLVLCIKSKYLYIPKKELKNKHFALLIDNSFLSNDTHHKIFRSVKKYYIDSIREIDILYTDNIMERCYNSKVLKLPKFKTIPELFQHTQTLNQYIYNR